MNRDQYKLIIANLLKKSSITQNADKIVFKRNPASPSSFSMLWPNASLGEDIRFGILEIDAQFLEFLNSGEAPPNARSADQAYEYMKEDALEFDRGKATQEQYDDVRNNLLIAQGEDFYDINRMLNNGDDKVFVKMMLDEGRKTELVTAFRKWKETGQGLKSELVPFLAKLQIKKISKRDKGEKLK